MASSNDYRRGAERLLDFLAAEYDEDGRSRSAPDNVQFYYKMPSTFAYGSRRRLAMRTLEQFERRFMASGSFDIADDPVAAPWAAYLGGWAAWGASALGRFDLAGRVMASVAPTQDMKLGGMVHKSQLGAVQDVERSAAAGMGFVWAMDLERAKLVGRFLEHALDRQQDDRAYHAYFDGEGAVVPDRADRNAFFSLDDDEARPALFSTGVSFLVWLGRAIGEEWPVELAHRYMRFVAGHRDDAAALPLTTKLGWSALMVATHVDDPMLTDFARRCADDLLARQLHDGSIDFDGVSEVPKPIDKLWLIGWGCDAALTLCAISGNEYTGARREQSQ